MSTSGTAKVIVCGDARVAPASALPSSIAARRLQCPPLSAQVPLPGLAPLVSAFALTTNEAAQAGLHSDRQASTTKTTQPFVRARPSVAGNGFMTNSPGCGGRCEPEACAPVAAAVRSRDWISV